MKKRPQKPVTMDDSYRLRRRLGNISMAISILALIASIVMPILRQSLEGRI